MKLKSGILNFKRTYRSIVFFFPLQLLFLYFRRNFALLVFWALLFGIISESVLVNFGIPALFLAPEYLDEVDFISFLILGVATGTFIMAFNVSSYMVNAYHFPFIATLSRPFFKYTINNFFIPLSFIVYFIYQSVEFQSVNEFLSEKEIVINILGFLAGVFGFMIIFLTYFFTTSRDAAHIYHIKEDNKPRGLTKPVRVILKKDMEWKLVNSPREQGKWKIETYLRTPFQIRRARYYHHYTPEMIQKVLQQNHINAGIFALGILLTIMLLANFMDNPYIVIPAAASVLLAFTLFILIFSTLHAIFKEWSLLVLAILIVAYNILSQNMFSDYTNSAYGLNYNIHKDKKVLEIAYPASIFKADHDSALIMLQNWKERNFSGRKYDLKPKIIFVNTGGGGIKAAIWTFYVLSKVDSLTGGQLLSRTTLITGASGGMVGAAYLRELYLQKQLGKIESYYDNKYITSLSKDMLNPIALSFALKDWFIKRKRYEYNGQMYYKDRAYAFEEKLNKNTGNVLDKTLKDYREPEMKAMIPMMILTPTIINDGRKLLISSQKISYMLENLKLSSTEKFPLSNVEFLRAYEEFGASELRFTTALRMNATFPYVTPVVTLPGTPQLNIMDAGLTDNYGLSTSLRFLYEFQEWIGKNTSGVIFIQISSDNEDYFDDSKGAISRFIKPMGNVYSNLFNNQIVNNQQLIEFSENWLQSNATFIRFSLRTSSDRIPLSWHLTTKDKQTLFNALRSEENQNSVKEVIKIIQ